MSWTGHVLSRFLPCFGGSPLKKNVMNNLRPGKGQRTVSQNMFTNCFWVIRIFIIFPALETKKNDNNGEIREQQVQWGGKKVRPKRLMSDLCSFSLPVWALLKLKIRLSSISFCGWVLTVEGPTFSQIVEKRSITSVSCCVQISSQNIFQNNKFRKSTSLIEIQVNSHRVASVTCYGRKKKKLWRQSWSCEKPPTLRKTKFLVAFSQYTLTCWVVTLNQIGQFRLRTS